MQTMKSPNEAGVDEVGRGCLLGPVFAAAVVLPTNINEIEGHEIIKDSKLLSKKNRKKAFDFIQKNAICTSTAFSDVEYIDEHNILRATISAMHKALRSLKETPAKILVDGTQFEKYHSIDHECVVQGDRKYMNIAAASIIAKVTRDDYIGNLCKHESELQEKYSLNNNMGYGTKKHIDGIAKFGICKHHRKTFNPCKNYLSSQ